MWTDDCSPDVIESIRTDMQRYLSYGWGNGIIAALLSRQYSVELSSWDIPKLRRYLQRRYLDGAPPEGSVYVELP